MPTHLNQIHIRITDTAKDFNPNEIEKPKQHSRMYGVNRIQPTTVAMVVLVSLLVEYVDMFSYNHTQSYHCRSQRCTWRNPGKTLSGLTQVENVDARDEAHHDRILSIRGSREIHNLHACIAMNIYYSY